MALKNLRGMELRRAWKDSGLTQTRFARKIGISSGMLYHYMKNGNGSAPKVKTVVDAKETNSTSDMLLMPYYRTEMRKCIVDKKNRVVAVL